MRGSHCLRHWSSTQSTIALSSGEAELGGMAKGMSQGLGLRSIGADLGISLQLRLRTDATAAMGMSRRLGVGKIRHLDTSLLWVQDKIRSGDVALEKAAGELNPGDALTKYLDWPTLRGHVERMGLVFEEGRADSAPQLTTSLHTVIASTGQIVSHESARANVKRELHLSEHDPHFLSYTWQRSKRKR